MSLPTEAPVIPSSPTEPTTKAADEPRFKTYALTLLGRFMRADKQEYPCKLLQISLDGATFTAPSGVEQGEHLIVYLDHIGGLEGTATHILEDGFAMRFSMTEHKREKLAEQLTWLLNRDANVPELPRRHVRSRLNDTTSKMTLNDGQILDVHILDVSISGASIKTDARPTRNCIIKLGKLRARVVRYHEEGIGVEFTDIQQPEALRKYFG